MSGLVPALPVAVLFLWSFLASAQSDTASISGRITDQGGEVLVGARVNATNVETGVGTSTLTNSEGVYVFPDLRPGPYRREAHLMYSGDEI
jgi:carboxypeptidase family protein